MINSTGRMFGINNRKAHSKYKPHPIFGNTNPLRPILQLFSPKKRSKSSDRPSAPAVPIHEDSSIILPGSYPLGPRPTTPDTSTTEPEPSTSSSSHPSSSSGKNTDSSERRKKKNRARLERTKSRMAHPAPRRPASSGPKGSARSQKSTNKSFERLHQDVHETLEPITESMNEEDRIFLEQMEKMVWQHKYKTGLVECRDTAERATALAPARLQERDEKLARLIEEEKGARVKLEERASEETQRDEARKMEQEQRRAKLEKASQVVEEKVKQGEIKRERTRELIRVLNKSELDIMASAQAPHTDQEHLRAELEKIAEARRQLKEEQETYRRQFEEIANARAELDEFNRCVQRHEEAARSQATARAAQLDEMFQAHHQLQQEIGQLQDEKEAAERKSDDVLFQARIETKRLRQEHARVLRETQEAGERTVAEAMTNFQVRLQEEAEARMRAEEQAAAARAAVAQAEAMMFAAAAAASASASQRHSTPERQFFDQWQAPPEYGMEDIEPPLPPPPPSPVLTDADRVILYERKWEALRGETETVFFEQVPWPVLIDLTHHDQLDVDNIRRFLTHELYLDHPALAGKSLRERAKHEMLRWHPDKFCRVLPKVEVTHREAVEETAERVAKLLTQLMREL